MLEKIGTQNLLYPMPVTIVGTFESDRANFINVAHVGILNAISPHKISLGMNKNHFTNHVIRKTREFSINLPSQNMVTATDYVGMVSGKSVDKSNVFETFFGTLKSAPLVKNCPLAMECRLIDIYNLPANDIFIGEIVASYADPEVMTGGKVDLAKVKPLLFDMTSIQYWSIGSPVAKCWQEGKKFKNS